MTPFECRTGPLSEADRNARIYAGHILVFRNVPALKRLTTRLHGLARDHLGVDPANAHRHLDPDGQARAASALRTLAAQDAGAKALLARALEDVGVDLDVTYRDPLKLRLQPPARDQADALVAPLAAHRDTWGANIMAQTNWWAPVLPIAANRTMAIFPGAFRTPVANDSADWDLVKFLEARDAGRPYPLLPLASDPPDWSAAVPIIIEPGDLMAFSGAHLHASVPNTSEVGRLSLEVRTINGPNAHACRGAPNVDGRAPWIPYNWFKHIRDRSRLGQRMPAGA
jgi:hypothetical protein